MPKILIICTANICRSPMAEALLRRKLDTEQHSGWEVSSAGTWARNGNPAPEYGRRLMSSVGMDISEHRSRVVNEEILAQADLVLTMETGHKEALRAEFPRHASRIYLLSEMVGFEQSVADPYGGPIEDWRDTAREINRFIEAGFDRIVGLALEASQARGA